MGVATDTLLTKMLAEIKANGVQVEHYPAQQCPCFDPRRGEGDPNCPACKGLYYIWAPTAAFTGQALVTNRESNRNITESGNWETGTIHVTLPPNVLPADFDKFIVTNDVVIVNNENLRVGATYSNGSSREVLRFDRVKEVLALTILNGGTVSWLTKGTDFNLDGNKIVWINQPANGTLYSVRYSATPTYLVRKNMPHLRQNSSTQFPWFATMQRLDMVTK